MACPLISVIIPVYNCEKYIKECVDSIVQQNYTPIEILLIDDGSTDNSPAICDLISQNNSNIRTIHKTNGGVSSVRNMGLDEAKGELIMFVDGDDLLETNAITTLYTTLLQDNTDIAEGLFYGYENGHKYISSFDKRRPRKRIINSDCALINTLQFRLNTGCWGKIYRRSTIGEIRFPEGQTFNEDCDFLFRLYQERNPKISLTDKHVYLYRRNPTSVTHSFTVKKFELLACADIYYEKFNKLENKAISNASKVYRNIIIANLFISLKRSGYAIEFPNQYHYLRSHLRHHMLSYLCGFHYTIKDRLKVLSAFF